MPSKTQIGRLLHFTSRNVFTNLAAEERLFQRAENNSLMFYVNSDAVVLGRTQNPFNEVDVAYAAAHNIPIARRRSGGGTVVHDEGNLNFCFVRSREEHEPLSNAKLVASVLREAFGIRAEVNQRADILVDGAKVSGAAYRISKGRAYHHGTLLIHSDLSRLRRLLKSPLSPGLVALGTQSVPSPVTNLNDHYSGTLHIRDVIDGIADRFSRTNAKVIPITPADVERDYYGMQAERGELCSHAWIYGKTPRFTYDYALDDHVFKFEIAKGTVISTVSVQPHDNSPQTPAQLSLGAMLAEILSGQLFDGRLLASRVRNAAKNRVLSSGPETQLFRDIQETLARRLQTDIPEQYWREDSEPSTETYN